MAVTNFKPELWAKMVLASLKKKSVGEFFVNHNYEGDIKAQGITVNINILNDVTVRDYDPTENLTYEDLGTTKKQLVINQAKYAAIKLDDVDKVQAAGELLGPATRNIAYKLNDAYDKFIFDTLIAAATASAGNMVGTDIAPVNIYNANNAIDCLIDVMTKANKNNIGDAERRAVVDPEVAGQIMKSDKRSITPKFAEFISNGYIGNLYGIEVFTSNNLATSTGGNHLILVTNPDMTTVASQILNMEALRSENSFKDLVRALHVYGGKTIYDTGVVGAYVSLANPQ